MRIRFQNYLFKANKRINHHLGHNRMFPADRIRILLWKINRLLLHFWLLEITQGRIRFWNYLFQADKIISCIQNLSGGYNLNLIAYLFREHNYCQNLILPIILSVQQKCFPYLDYFLMTKSLFGPEIDNSQNLILTSSS